MSRLLNSIPYLLASGTILLGIFQLIKEWDEYDKLRFRWLRRAALAVLILIAALTFVSLHHDDKTRTEEKSKAEGDIRDLKGKVQSANDAQRDNTKLFVDSFGAMSKEVSNLKAEVKTEALQKKLATVEAELQKTQKAMAPGPKAELAFTFMPFINPSTTSSAPAVAVTNIDLPMNLDGSMHIEGAVMNLTSVDAADIDLNLLICDLCKYLKEPPNFTKLTGFPDNLRQLKVPHVQALTAALPITLDITPPPNVTSFTVGFTYRCTTCIVTKKASLGTVHISGR
jgi:hypothetical protein